MKKKFNILSALDQVFSRKLFGLCHIMLHAYFRACSTAWQLMPSELLTDLDRYSDWECWSPSSSVQTLSLTDIPELSWLRFCHGDVEQSGRNL